MTRRKWVRGLETRCAVAPKRDSYHNKRAALWMSETKKRKKKKTKTKTRAPSRVRLSCAQIKDAPDPNARAARCTSGRVASGMCSRGGQPGSIPSLAQPCRVVVLHATARARQRPPWCVSWPNILKGGSKIPQPSEAKSLPGPLW